MSETGGSQIALIHRHVLQLGVLPSTAQQAWQPNGYQCAACTWQHLLCHPVTTATTLLMGSNHRQQLLEHCEAAGQLTRLHGVKPLNMGSAAHAAGKTWTADAVLIWKTASPVLRSGLLSTQNNPCAHSFLLQHRDHVYVVAHGSGCSADLVGSSSSSHQAKKPWQQLTG